MAQQIIPAAQLVPKFQGIGRCNNYVVLQSIPCSPECKIVGQILLDHSLSYALTTTADVPAVFKMDTQEITYTVDMFRDTLKLPVETLENPFVVPATIKIIESFMHMVGYQGVVDKVSAIFTKNLAQPWKTMFKLFDDVVNRTNVDYAALLWWDFMNIVFQIKDVIQYPRFTKLIIAKLIKKYPSISSRLEEDYHSIKDDIPLVSVYTTGNVQVRGMLISDAFLTKEIRTTDDYKEYETVFVNVAVPMNQLQPGKKRKQSAREKSSPQTSLKVTIKHKLVVKGEKDVESYADKFAASMIHNDVDDSRNMIEPESHKEHPKFVKDDDVNEEEKTDEKKDDKMGSLEIRSHKMQTQIPTPPRSPRINLSLDKNINQELTVTVSPSTTTSSKDPHKKRHISNKYSHLPRALRRMCRRQGYIIRDMERKCVTTDEFWKVHGNVDQVLHEIVPQLAERATNDLIEINLKPIVADTIIQE
ncbi:hypothetical protein Tco_1146552 [Tanacetum coccineum]